MNTPIDSNRHVPSQLHQITTTFRGYASHSSAVSPNVYYLETTLIDSRGIHLSLWNVFDGVILR